MMAVKIVSLMLIESLGQKLGQTPAEVASSVQAPPASTSRNNQASRRVTGPASPS